MNQAHYMYGVFYIYCYYISTTSDHQALDPEGWEPLLQRIRIFHIKFLKYCLFKNTYLFCGENFALKMRSPELEYWTLRKFLNHSGSQFLFLLVEDIRGPLLTRPPSS